MSGVSSYWNYTSTTHLYRPLTVTGPTSTPTSLRPSSPANPPYPRRPVHTRPSHPGTITTRFLRPKKTYSRRQNLENLGLPEDRDSGSPRLFLTTKEPLVEGEWTIVLVT